MAEERARVVAEFDGAQAVASEAKKVSNALRQAEKDAEATAKGAGTATKETGGLGDALRSLAPRVAGIGMGAAGAIGLIGLAAKATIDYGRRAADAAASFGQKTSQSARRAGVDLGALRATVSRNETATLQSADAQTDFVNALAKTTYNGKGAAESLRSVGINALASGRDLSELLPVVASLQSGLQVKGDVGDELQRLADLAQRLKTIGGPQALQDGIAALRPAFEAVNVASAGARANLEAFFAVLSPNRKPGAAQAVVSSAVGLIRGRAIDVERTLGRQVIGDNGEVENPMTVIEDLQKHLRRRYRGNAAAQRRAAIAEFGPELGTAIYSTDFGKVRDEGFKATTGGGSILSLDRRGPIQAPTLGQPTETERAAADYLASPEGQREKREAEARARAEDLGRTPLALRDTYDKVVSETAAAGHTIVNAISGAGEPSTVDLSPKSAAAIGEATANALRQRPPEIKLPLLSDPNAFKGN